MAARSQLTNIVVAYFEFSKWGRASTPLLVGGNEYGSCKYVDWRLIVTAPFEEDVELFVTARTIVSDNWDGELAANGKSLF
jgi:hypothetical protein